jgi:predicted rRNA methylase YqxC with S4 and FtsJ domains
MKLYQKLKDQDLVENMKDFSELVRLRAVKVNGNFIDDPDFELNETDKDIKVGILSVE